jgi:hypothetical protein
VSDLYIPTDTHLNCSLTEVVLTLVPVFSEDFWRLAAHLGRTLWILITNVHNLTVWAAHDHEVVFVVLGFVASLALDEQSVWERQLGGGHNGVRRRGDLAHLGNAELIIALSLQQVSSVALARVAVDEVMASSVAAAG